MRQPRLQAGLKRKLKFQEVGRCRATFQGDKFRSGRGRLILADRAAAWNEAMRACGDMISDGHLKMGAGWRMEVWDEEGPIFVVRVDAHELF
ncbi:DUF6894 family protein [Mesorhizobium sp. ZC-5]|uniref:DUF6894 family protein n=1 Tax=Mesorhizobium sp. ZC-5 TaxID=2986066 RepID=UPI003996AE91